jgi:hypothetical protein
MGVGWGLGHPRAMVRYSIWARTGVGDRVVADMGRLWAGLGWGQGDGASIDALRVWQPRRRLPFARRGPCASVCASFDADLELGSAGLCRGGWMRPLANEMRRGRFVHRGDLLRVGYTGLSSGGVRLGEARGGTGWGQKPKTELPELGFGERNSGGLVFG